MSTLWTPSGERPIRREPEPSASGPVSGGEPAGSGGPSMSDEEVEAQMAELRDRLARTPAEVVVANHAYGLFELAALHLSLDPPQLSQARLAIDALAALVEGLGPRLGQPAPDLVESLSNLRMAFVRVASAQPGGEPHPGGVPGDGG